MECVGRLWGGVESQSGGVGTRHVRRKSCRYFDLNTANFYESKRAPRPIHRPVHVSSSLLCYELVYLELEPLNHYLKYGMEKKAILS